MYKIYKLYISNIKLLLKYTLFLNKYMQTLSKGVYLLLLQNQILNIQLVEKFASM